MRLKTGKSNYIILFPMFSKIVFHYAERNKSTLFQFLIKKCCTDSRGQVDKGKGCVDSRPVEEHVNFQSIPDYISGRIDGVTSGSFSS